MDRQATPMPPDSSWPQRVRNALLLSAYAEALAAPFAGRPLPEPVLVDAALRDPDPGVHGPGCGSAQTLVVAEHLAQRGGSLDADAMAIVLNRHHGSGPTAEGFQGTRKAIPHPRASLGNEAAVRATPIGLLPHTGIGTVAVIARRNAAVSHEHPLAQDGAAVHAVAVALAAHGQPAPAMDAKQFLATLVTQTRTPEFRSALGIVRMLARHRAGPAEIAATVGHDTSALRSVPAALAAYLRHPEDPAAAIRHAILIGGDTQAIAAMTGALAGARNPTFPAPAGWPGLADNVAISAAAEALAGVA